MQPITGVYRATLRAAAFLTRLPIPAAAFEDLADSAEAPAAGENEASSSPCYQLSGDAHTFPLVGLIAAAPAALLLVALPPLGLSPLVTAILAVAALVAMTGALHEDGLGDVADGLFGHHDRTRTLDIMHDSRVGNYGAIALILSLGLRAALLAELGAARPILAAGAMLAAATASRGAMAAVWALTPPATNTGLAARAGQPSARRGRVALILGSLIAIAIALPLAGLLPSVAAILLAALTLIAFRRALIRRLGGQTGDCLGTAQQLCEIAVLLGLAMGR
ncbi:adenosylcobinamide-GDP ribazoletransferase [Jiella sp. MQZ9-1]|uniref:Adenosylcobinamide-GDP ribazoletransferase n=1 Tax=Jiella flava TaxID=2816857 RepID=A0A939JV95_9HYPH|nr:adenosylcobinamide-GDP ribazoletransferase [Jiella flava]MBO0661762.1 adenosylcobinamide-GDP ribazoletransferase [Jiella flava]MCD2470403.1 adenosylcobinamide-GDP ribazoletransferase [Jiella flava]